MLWRAPPPTPPAQSPTRTAENGDALPGCCVYFCREGEEGDNFYAIESGTFVATKAGEQKFRYEGKGSFGELALMYNCPRAATVIARSEGGCTKPCPAPAVLPLCHTLESMRAPTSFLRCGCCPGVLWALDRATFRNLVVGSMVERRQRHEATLKAMPVFQHLSHEQLAAIADCLSPETYQVCRGGGLAPCWPRLQMGSMPSGAS